jgi:hypothetical protein
MRKIKNPTREECNNIEIPYETTTTEDTESDQDKEVINTIITEKEVHPDLTYLYLHIGATSNQYVTIRTLKDNGATKTFITRQTFHQIPNFQDLPLEPCNIAIGTASQQQGTLCQYTVNLWVSFNTLEGRSEPRQFKFYIVDNMTESIYLGNDFLTGPMKIMETATELILTTTPNIQRVITITPADDLYSVPLYTQNLNPQSPMVVYPAKGQTLKIRQDITLKSGQQLAVKQYLTTAHAYDPSTIFTDAHRTAAITCEPIDNHHVWLIILNLSDKYPCHIPTGTRFYDNDSEYSTCPRTAQINNIQHIQHILDEDPHMNQEEKEEEIRQFMTEGHCSVSASHYIEMHGKLQIFAPEKAPLKDFTPEQLIAELPVDHLPEPTQQYLREMFKNNITVLARNEFDVQHTDLIEATIEVKQNDRIMDTKYLPIPAGLREDADKLIQYYLDKGVLAETGKPSPFISNVLFQRKTKTGKIRGILDARLINFNTKKLACSLTSHQEILDLLSEKTHISTIDISNSYFSIPLSKDTAHYTTFFDHRRRRLHFTSCPQGWINSAYYLDQLLSMLFATTDDVLWVADDIIIATKGTIEQHLAKIEHVIKQLIRAKLRVKHTKLSICQDYTEFLGIMYHNGKMSIPEARVQGYMDYPIPVTPKQMKGFIASISYYRKFIPKYAELTLRLHQLSLLDNKQKIKLNEEEMQDFVKIQTAIKDAVSLQIPQADRQFICYSDASNFAVSFVVEQVDKEGNRYPIAFLSKMLTKSEKQYGTFKKEAIALLYGLTTMEFFFLNQPKVILKTDARSLLFLRACKGSGSFLTRVALQLSAYPIEIHHIPGKLNVIADVLSRNNNKHDPALMYEEHKSAMSEKEAQAFISRLIIPDSKPFTVEEVKELLEGDHLPSPKPPRPSTRKLDSTLYTNKTTLPKIKHERKIKMPRITDHHPFYPNQQQDLTEEKAARINALTTTQLYPTNLSANFEMMEHFELTETDPSLQNKLFTPVINAITTRSQTTREAQRQQLTQETRVTLTPLEDMNIPLHIYQPQNLPIVEEQEEEETTELDTHYLFQDSQTDPTQPSLPIDSPRAQPLLDNPTIPEYYTPIFTPQDELPSFRDEELTIDDDDLTMLPITYEQSNYGYHDYRPPPEIDLPLNIRPDSPIEPQYNYADTTFGRLPTITEYEPIRTRKRLDSITRPDPPPMEEVPYDYELTEDEEEEDAEPTDRPPLIIKQIQIPKMP